MPPRKQRTPALAQQVRAKALALLEDHGPAGLRARAVAEAAGTSTAAVYELFGDKSGLIRSIYGEGFQRLKADLEALPSSDDPADDLRALFQGTRRFARRQPQLFEVMFSRPFAEFEPDASDREHAGSLFSLVVDRVTVWLSSVGSDADPVDVARVLISTSRGLIADEQAGILGSTIINRNRRWELTFDALLAGIAGQAEPLI
ncbi:MAG: TetR/AcrR family transcriptional regulator [Actinomycetota bacterium]